MWISIFGHYDNWDKIGDFLKNCVKAYDADNNVVDGNAEKLYYNILYYNISQIFSCLEFLIIIFFIFNMVE